jgi:L-ascorbate metabolism protein UlaG (beta-lactamase superfamily)
MIVRCPFLAFAALAIALFVGALFGVGQAQAEGADRCLAVSEAPQAFARVDLPLAPLDPLQARLTFVGHATWLIESPGGVRIATDYNDFVRPPLVPDVATMNRAHATHYSLDPDPRIAHVLRGWNPQGGPVSYDVTIGDVRIRNVQTDIRDWVGGVIAYGNSIFIFEIAGMCIAHLGHLHHTLSPQQIAQIGQLDVVMVPVDGSYTMDTPGMVEVLRSLRARLILPMHYFNAYTLNRFLDRVRGEFAVEIAEQAMIVVSQATLPSEPKVLVLPGG